MNLKNIPRSILARNLSLAFLTVLAVLGIFQAGVFVGYHKAFLARRLMGNDMRGPGPGGSMGFVTEGDIASGHGAVGQIVKISLPQIIVADKDRSEKDILVSSETKIRQFRNELTASQLKVDDFVVILGAPNNNGQIAAKFIRLLPAPPGFRSSTSAATSTSPAY